MTEVDPGIRFPPPLYHGRDQHTGQPSNCRPPNYWTQRPAIHISFAPSTGVSSSNATKRSFVFESARTWFGVEGILGPGQHRFRVAGAPANVGTRKSRVNTTTSTSRQQVHGRRYDRTRFHALEK